MPTTRTPRYLQLAAELRTAIAGGDFPDGFPTEQALTDRYKVSRFTIREALRTLKDEGLISRRRGSGTTIEAAATRGGALHQPLSNVAELQQYARDTRLDFAWQDSRPLPRVIAEAIGYDERRLFDYWSGMRTNSDGSPLAATEVYVPKGLINGIGKISPGQGAICNQIEAVTGVKIASVRQDIQACAADARLAAALHIEPGAPVLRIIRSYLDKDGFTFEIAVSQHPGDRFAYGVHFEADG